MGKWLWFHQPLYRTLKWKLHQVQAEAQHFPPQARGRMACLEGFFRVVQDCFFFNDLL